MSLNNVNNLDEKNMVEIEFTVSRVIFDAAVTNAYRKNVAKMNIPGFRKGKAPRNIIEKMYGKGVFYDDALNEVIPEAYEAALKESGADAVSRPEFDVVSIDDGEDVVLKAKFYIKPDVTLADYKGLAAERVITPVTDEDVDTDIQRVRERNSRLIDITDRAAQDGDTVVIDYKGFADDNQFEGGTAEGHNLKLGSGQFIPGFEDQIIGKNVGDEFDVNVTFPEEYQSEELKGKDAKFEVKLHEIKFSELPELDDEFAKDVSEFDTFDEYKADVRARIEERNSKASDATLDETLIDGLLAGMEADVPPPMIENESENLLRDYDNRLRMQGLDLSTYFRYTGLDLDTMREQFKPQAERQVKAQLALEKVAELESIVVEESDIEEEFENIAKAYNMEIEKVKESVTGDMLEGDLKLRKAMKFVRENAVVTDVEKAEEPVSAEEIAEIVEEATAEE